MERKVGMKTLVAYGMGDMYGGGAFMIVGMLFLFYLTEVVGLSPALAGMVFGIGKVWDAVSDPLMGYLSDRTRSRFGRRRVYFLAGIVPIALSFIILCLAFVIFYFVVLPRRRNRKQKLTTLRKSDLPYDEDLILQTSMHHSSNGMTPD